MTRFAFRAGAAAAGGFFTRPFSEPLPVQAASFLTQAGGYGSARVEHFRYHEIISFTAASTQVMGTRRTDNRGVDIFDTLAQAVIEDLNILGVVTADRVVARLTSETRADAGTPEMSASPFGSHFVNLRIAGQPVVASCHPRLFDKDAATKTGIVTNKLASRLGDDAGRTRTAAAPTADDTLRFSIFDPIQQPMSGAVPGPGCRINVPTLGDIFLGEFVVTAGHRQLTMLRIELHSPEEGEVVFAAVEGNGSVY
jgi:hypothetical protein